MTQPFQVFDYGDSQAGPQLLITAGVHGDEFESIAAVLQLVDRFAHGDPSIRRLKGQLKLVPIVNEPAFRGGHRCGTDGLDLARVCPGRVDGSPTEQIAAALSQLIREADHYIDLHTGGSEYAVYPLAGYLLHHDHAVLDAQRRMARAFQLPLVWGTSPDLPGRSLSIARDAGIPAIYCEYGGSATCNPAGVAAYVEGCLRVMAALQMLEPVHRGQTDPKVIEDPSPGSGHLQICHPAPATGLFLPAVSLGTQVLAGQTLGLLRELENHRNHVISADRDGLVIMLKTFPRAIEGQSLAVVAREA